MKTEFPISSHDSEINATLALLAKVRPTDGLEQRIQLRLAQAGPARRPWHAFFTSPFTSREIGISASKTRASRVRAVAASLVAATAIIAGVLVYSSRRVPIASSLTHAAPAMNGFGAAAAIRMAPPAVKPALHTRGRGAPSHGRAAIRSHHKPLPSGVAVPHSPPPYPAPSPQ